MSNTIDLISLAAELGPQFAEGADTRDVDATFVAENYAALKERKVFSAMVPAELGGGGVRHSEMCAFLRALAAYCPSTALSLSMHQHLVGAAVFNDRNGKPGRKLLERVAGNEAVLVSTGANDWLESNGSSEKVEGGYRVHAKKPFGSGSPAGDALVTSVPYQDPREGWQVLHMVVPFSAEGVSLGNDWDTMGMRATGSHTVVLDNVFVPEEAVALKRPQGEYHPAWSVILTVAMPLIMSVYTGVADAAAEIARQQAARRTTDPVTPFLMGELTNLLTTAQIAAEDMVRIANDFAFEPSVETASAILARKTIVAQSVRATVEKALEVCGGAGFFRRFKLERLLRDAHAAHFHPLQEKRQHSFTGRLAMGLDPIATAPMQPLRAAAE